MCEQQSVRGMQDQPAPGLGYKQFVLFSKLFSREQNTSHPPLVTLKPSLSSDPMFSLQCMQISFFIVNYNSYLGITTANYTPGLQI